MLYFLVSFYNLFYYHEGFVAFRILANSLFSRKRPKLKIFEISNNVFLLSFLQNFVELDEFFPNICRNSFRDVRLMSYDGPKYLSYITYFMHFFFVQISIFKIL
jgi:hypothetical protein